MSDSDDQTRLAPQVQVKCLLSRVAHVFADIGVLFSLRLLIAIVHYITLRENGVGDGNFTRTVGLASY
jgi:hypothetical protein